PRTRSSTPHTTFEQKTLRPPPPKTQTRLGSDRLDYDFTGGARNAGIAPSWRGLRVCLGPHFLCQFSYRARVCCEPPHTLGHGGFRWTLAINCLGFDGPPSRAPLFSFRRFRLGPRPLAPQARVGSG